MDARIDLTLNRDFSNSRINIITSDEFHNFVDEAYSMKAMSSDDYMKLVLYESFFGKKRHYSSFVDVFSKSDEEFMKEWRYRCHRCGKEHRIPWKITGELCEDCEHEMNKDEGKRFREVVEGPIKLSFDSFSDDRGRDLFSLR